MDAVVSKRLTSSDVAAFRIVLPKLDCEAGLKRENLVAQASTDRAALLHVCHTGQLPQSETATTTTDGKRWPFRYRISPCGKSFLHTLHDQGGVLASLGAAEGDRVTLYRRAFDQQLFIGVCIGSCASSSVDDSSIDREDDHSIKVAARAPASDNPFANKRIRIGGRFQASVPPFDEEPQLVSWAESIASASKPRRLIAMDDLYAQALVTHDKDMCKIARELGVSIGECVEYYYYRWSAPEVPV